MPPTQSQLRAVKRMEARIFAKLAEDLARLIADAGLTPSALAREAGVSHAFLSRILAAKARPSVWPTCDVGPVISQLLIARRTRANRRLAEEFRQQLAVAFPGHPEDAIGALTALAPWPGSALVWATVDARGVRLIPTRE